MIVEWEKEDVQVGRVVLIGSSRQLIGYRYSEKGKVYTRTCLSDGLTSTLGASEDEAALALNKAKAMPAEVFNFKAQRAEGREARS